MQNNKSTGLTSLQKSAIRRLTRQPEAKNKDITSSDPNKNVDVSRHET